MVSIENADYYGMEEFLSDSNLGLLTNDWPGNDPLSNSSNETNLYAGLEQYLPVNQEAFTPTTSDSGNHSPTSSSSDGNGGQKLFWKTDGLGYQQKNSPPEPVDLELLESLLYDKGRNSNQFSEVCEEEYDESQDVIYGDNGYFNQEPGLSIQNGQLHHDIDYSKVLSSNIKKMNRPAPYQIIRPSKSPLLTTTSNNSVSMIPMITTTSPQPGVALVSQPQYILTTSSQQAMPGLNANTILVPANVLPLAPVQLKKEQAESNVDFLKKSEERRRRNRESAQVSRERKKIEFEQMKTRITELEQENHILKQRMLNCRCGANQPQNRSQTGYGGIKTVGVSLFAIFALVAIVPRGFSPTIDLIEPQIAPIKNESNATGAMIHIGSRALLAVDNYDYSAEYDPVNISKTSANESKLPKCSNGYLNTTELLKVNTDLINWIDRHDKMNLVQLRAGDSPYLIYNSQKQLIFPEYAEFTIANSTDLMNVSQTVRRTGRNRRTKEQNLKQKERAWRHINMIGPQKPKPTDNALATQETVQKHIMKQLAAQLKQNDDTLYVMALKDYIILPQAATKPGETPKISIVLPALSLNSSMPNHIPMMRIECTVTSTNLFFLPERLVTLFNGSVSN